MGNRFVYYCVLLPISILPYPVLYLFSDFTFIVLYHLTGYRKKVVFPNIQNSFPQKTLAEQKEIQYKFYRHFCDLIFEAIKGFSISEKQLLKRITFHNPEVLDRFFDEGKDVILVGGHYNNWEIFTTGIGLSTKHIPVGIYKPLSSAYFNEKMKKSRERFRLRLCPMKETREFIEKDLEVPKAIIFAIDQSPSNVHSCHWMKFLNQDTPVFYGAEKYAREFNLPLVFGAIHKVKRGFYALEYEVLCEFPNLMDENAITEMNTWRLEKDIVARPEFWLWSHRRWKHKRPESRILPDH